MGLVIRYVHGDATDIEAGILAHIVNDQGGWGRGFVRALSARWPEPEADYRAWARRCDLTVPFQLGYVRLSRVRPDLYVAHMLAQRGYSTPSRPAVDYVSLQMCLRAVRRAHEFLALPVHMPRIGCGLGGGSWDQVEPLLREQLVRHGVPVTVYDWP